jgi:hypothetical protein
MAWLSQTIELAGQHLQGFGWFRNRAGASSFTCMPWSPDQRNEAPNTARASAKGVGFFLMNASLMPKVQQGGCPRSPNNRNEANLVTPR